MDAKQNDINKGFRKFFSNIGLKLTVKRDLGDPADVPDDANKQEPNTAEDTEDPVTKGEKDQLDTDENKAPETFESTTCPTLTDVTSEDMVENPDETPTDTKEEVESDNVDAALSSPAEDLHQDATPQEEPNSPSPTSPEDEEVVSPIKKFFSTGFFSGLRKKKSPAEDETVDKELEDMKKKDEVKTIDQDKETIGPGAVEDAVEGNDLEEEILPAPSAQMTEEGKSSPRDPSTTATEPEILSSQEKVQASPLKRFLSGSNLMKRPKTQRSRKSSDAKLSDSGENVSDQLQPLESPENHKEDTTQASTEPAREEDGAWATFKKLMTPKKRLKRPSLSNEESKIPDSVEEPQKNEREQISDQSTEEGKKRKDSSVSWEAVLCGSGRRKSRKTSDSEDETPQIDISDQKRDGRSKRDAEVPLEVSKENENEILATSPKQAECLSEGDGGSTWKSLKRIVTPKRKAKDEDERTKDSVQSDNELTQDDSSFSIKKLLPGRKKRKSDDKQIEVPSDEADKDVASDDEDSETPAVVPLSEYDMDEPEIHIQAEPEIHIQTQPDVESHTPQEENYELQQDKIDKPAPPSVLKDTDEALETQVPATFSANEKPDDLTESVSKHQQLSDIPEEGIITETMATPASDETIAEDLIEITSEAITAPEPAADITLTDETEMISAVSQLSSESSKTSGNTTPVQAEYDIMETDPILHQVVETISMTTNTAPLYSNELSSEKVVGSVSPQVLESFVKSQPTILELHKRFDATVITTGLHVKELEAVDELTAQSLIESVSEVEAFISTESVSEIATEEYKSAEMTADEIQEVSVTEPPENIYELERIDDSNNLAEKNTAISANILTEGDKIVQEVGSPAEPHLAETETLPIDSEEADSAATVTDETLDSVIEPVVQTVTEKDHQFVHGVPDEIQVEDKKQPSVEEEELQELAKEQVARLLETDTVTPEQQEPITEPDVEGDKTDGLEIDADESVSNCPEVEPVIEEPRQTAEPPAIVSADPENKELPVEGEHDQEAEVLEAVQVPLLESVEISTESFEKEVISLDSVNASQTVQEPGVLQAFEGGDIQSCDKEVIPEYRTKTETITEEPKQATEVPTAESDDKKSPVEAEQVEEPDVLLPVQAPTLDSEDGSVPSLEKEAIPEHLSEAELATEEPKQTKEPITAEPDDKESPVDAEQVQEPEVVLTVQPPILDSEDGIVQSLEKEAISEYLPEAEPVTEEPKQTTEPLTTEPDDKKMPVEAKHLKEELQALGAPSLDLEEGSVQSLEKEVVSENLPEAGTDTDGPMETIESPTVDSADPENKEAPVVVEHGQEPEVLLTVQTPSQGMEEDSVQSFEKEVASENLPEAETDTDGTKETRELPIIVSTDPESKEAPGEVEHVQQPEVLPSQEEVTLLEEPKEEPKPLIEDNLLQVDASQTVQELEEGSIQSHEEEVQSEHIPKAGRVTDEPREETVLPSEIDLEVDGASKTIEEPEVLQIVQEATLASKVGSISSPTEELKQEQQNQMFKKEETLPVEEAKTEQAQVPEVSPPNAKDVVTVTKTEEVDVTHEDIVTECTEEGSAQEVEKQIILKETIKTDTNNATVLAGEQTEGEVAKLDQALDITEDKKIENIPKEAQVEQEYSIPEVVDELQTLTAVHVASVHEESSNIQVLVKSVSEEAVLPDEDNAAVTDELRHDVHLSTVQVSLEQEKEGELPDIDTMTAEVKHAAVTEVDQCEIKDVSVALPDVSKEQTSEGTEPLIAKVTSEQEFTKEVEAATPLVKDDVTKTAEKGGIVVMMRVPSVRFEDDHKIQVQVVDVDVNAAETNVDSLLKAGVTETKDVIKVCHETLEKVNNLSATEGIEEQLINKERNVTKQEVIQHVKEKLPETRPESVAENLEQGRTYPLSEMGDSELSEVDYQTAVEDYTETFKEIEEEEPEPTVISGSHADPTQTPETQQSFIDDRKEDLEETRYKQDKTEESTAADEVKLASEDLDLRKSDEQARLPQMSPTVTSSNTEIAVPQNTGIVSSIGNVESLSNISLEFKLNIQFGQPKAPVSPPPTMERISAEKQIDVSDIGVQTVKPVNPPERAKNQKQTDLTEAAVQATKTVEQAVNLGSTEKVLPDVGNQVMETVEPVEQITLTERVTANIQAAETLQPVRPTEKIGAFLSHPELSEACDPKTEAGVSGQDIDRDVWMDAEEAGFPQEETEAYFCEVEEPLEPPTASEQEEKTGLGHEVDLDLISKMEEEERKEEVKGECDIESDNEDFAVALEHLDKENMSITMEE